MSHALEQSFWTRPKFLFLTAVGLAVFVAIMNDVGKTLGEAGIIEGEKGDTDNCEPDENEEGEKKEHPCECHNKCGCEKTFSEPMECVMCLFEQCQK